MLASTSGGLAELSKSLLELVARLGEQIRGQERLVGIGLIIIGSQLYYLNKFSYWSRRNFKHPRPLPFVGNALSYLIHSYHDLSHAWSKKYGKVYGYYQGVTPYLVVADAKVLKQICIKDFDKFTNRHFVDLPSDFQKQFLLLKEDEQWRSMRHFLSPTFSSGKIKIMYRIMDKSVDKLLEQLEQILANQQESEVNIRASAGQISMSSTIGSLYGIDLSFRDPKESNSVQNFSALSQEAFTPPKLDVIFQYFVPHWILRLLNFPNMREENLHALTFFKNKAKSIINQRLRSGERKNDYLQILLEARAEERAMEEAKEVSHHAFGGELNRPAAESNTKTKLSEAEIICHTVLFMLVATETTAGLIANTIYLLAFNKHVQKRLYDELAGIRKFDEHGRAQFEYEEIGMHQYLDCVISESLRLMPPALYLDRKAGTDYFLEDYNAVIPKGTPIVLDFYGIQTDPDYWPEPERFDPDRFSPENKGNIVPGSYCPFGIGPRHCIGYRFALTEGKLAIAKLVSEFEFDVAPGSKFPPEPRKPVFIGNEFTSLRTIVKRRDATQ